MDPLQIKVDDQSYVMPDGVKLNAYNYTKSIGDVIEFGAELGQGEPP